MQYLYAFGALVAAGVVLWPILSNALYGFFLKRLTGVVDLDEAALPRKGPKIDGTAVIAGGSFGGLAAARVLSTHFRQVVLLEAETMPKYHVHRKNIAQFGQLHVLLQFGYSALCKLFPNTIKATIKEAGGRVLEGDSVKPNYLLGGGFIQSLAHKLPTTLVMSRFGYEPLLRKLVRDNTDNVEWINASVTGLEVSADKQRVTSVSYRVKDSQETKRVAADFVVDATGPACAGVGWLKQNGIAQPKKIFYNPYITYVTATFPCTEELKAVQWPNGGKWNEYDGITLYASAADPFLGKTHGSYFQHYEHDRLLVCVLGYGKEPPFQISSVEDLVDVAARDFPEFSKIGRGLIAEARKNGEDLPVPKVFLPQCYKVDYDAVASQLPQNFTAIGDSRCRVNPTYGQGMSKAFLDAVTLDSVLRTHNHLHFTSAYFKKQAMRADGLLDFTKGEDYKWESTVPTEGETRQWGAGMRWFVGNFVKAAHKDAQLGTVFWTVNWMMGPPTSLFAPVVVFKVLKQALLG